MFEEINKNEYKNNLRSIEGTFAVEGMTLNKNCRKNLDRIALEQTDYRIIIQELNIKYKR